MKVAILFVILTFCAFAKNKAPDNFMYKGKRMVFVDFISADYSITYDIEKEKAVVESIIEFKQTQPGHPIFDLKAAMSELVINGQAVEAISLKSPDEVTKYKSIDQSLSSGTHKLSLKNNITENISFGSDYVNQAFWMSDLSDRKYIEQYVPANIEFDQYAMSFHIKIKNASKKHVVYTNGELEEISKNEFKIITPDYFTASSFYFHMVQDGKFDETKFTFKRSNGKSFPVQIYKKNGGWWGTSLSSLKSQTIKVLKELDKKFGPWPHPSLTIYNAGSGGMEHSGATITSVRALGHELIHSYFARGVMPVDGNSGWMDEAIASWRDDGYPKTKSPSFRTSKMAGHSQYRRTTDRRAYSDGANFMAYLNKELKTQGGLTTFLKELHTHYTHKAIHTDDFIKELKDFGGRSFQKDFDQYIFGSDKNNGLKEIPTKDNPYHPKLSKKQLLELL